LIDVVWGKGIKKTKTPRITGMLAARKEKIVLRLINVVTFNSIRSVPFQPILDREIAITPVKDALVC
jgi:hypothetical protein